MEIPLGKKVAFLLTSSAMKKINVKSVVIVVILISVSTVSFCVCLYKDIKVIFVLLVGSCYLFRMTDYFHMY